MVNAEDSQKEYLRLSLAAGRDAILSRLDGLSEFEMRRPMTRTGTNLLGLVKHLTGMEATYLGERLGRPFPERLPWYEEGRGWDNEDMWATADESSGFILDLYRQACVHSDATIASHALSPVGGSNGDRDEMTLLEGIVTVLGETYRHGGHADIVRELVDGKAGASGEKSLLAYASDDDNAWAAYVTKLSTAADHFRSR
jgi:hypothetical protein